MYIPEIWVGIILGIVITIVTFIVIGMNMKKK